MCTSAATRKTKAAAAKQQLLPFSMAEIAAFCMLLFCCPCWLLLLVPCLLLREAGLPLAAAPCPPPCRRFATPYWGSNSAWSCPGARGVVGAGRL